MDSEFYARLRAMNDAQKHICVGLDINIDELPQHLAGDRKMRIQSFVKAIVDATIHLAAAYKPNTAFYEALGSSGPEILRETVAYIHSQDSGVPVIIDAKRGDISSTNNGSAEFVFEYLKGDAVTVHPYLGHEAMRPFLERRDKGIFVLCRTSNSGAGEFQDLEVNGDTLFLRVATSVRDDWNRNKNCGLVAGATYPHELKQLRDRAPELPLLIPGIGAQGGDLEAALRAAHANNALFGVLNSSRQILYASDGEDFAEAAAARIREMHGQIVSVLSALH